MEGTHLVTHILRMTLAGKTYYSLPTSFPNPSSNQFMFSCRLLSLLLQPFISDATYSVRRGKKTYLSALYEQVYRMEHWCHFDLWLLTPHLISPLLIRLKIECLSSAQYLQCILQSGFQLHLCVKLCATHVYFQQWLICSSAGQPEPAGTAGVFPAPIFSASLMTGKHVDIT